MTFQERFFGPGNRLRWTAIQFGSLPPTTLERLAPFLEDLSRNPDVAVLPRVREDGVVQWYFLCASPRAARVARDEMRAFLGPSYIGSMGTITLNPDDPVDAAVLDHYGLNAFGVTVGDNTLVDVVRERVNLMRRVRLARPARIGKRVRATGRLLRDFEYALLSKDGDEAFACIGELRATGRLGAANLLFLEIRRLAALGLWSAVLDVLEVPALLSMRRPRRVTEALIQAVYNTELVVFETDGRPADALQYFKEGIAPHYGDLYRSRAGLSGFEVEASFFLAALAGSPARLDQADSILEAIPASEPRRKYLIALRATIVRTPPSIPTEALAHGRARLFAGDVDGAFAAAQMAPPSFGRAALLLQCSWEMGTLAAAEVALRAVAALVPHERAELDRRVHLARICRDLHELLEYPISGRPPSGKVPTSWPEWLGRLTLAEAWPAAVAVAEAGAREWQLETYLQDERLMTETGNLLLASRPAWGDIAVRDALPYLVSFFTQRTEARLRRIYDHLFLLLALDESGSLPQFRSLLRLAEVRLDLGISSSEYAEMLDHLGSATERIGSPAIGDAALDAIDVLIVNACPASSARQAFTGRVQGLFRKWYQRFDASQWRLLESLCGEIGIPCPTHPLPPEEERPGFNWMALEGKRVALYSLRESAVRRAEAVVRNLCPGVHVQTFTDLVGGSPSLRAAAATADIFVLASAAAKHVATQFIEAHRPKDKPILYARGQGSASLIAAIREYNSQMPVVAG